MSVFGDQTKRINHAPRIGPGFDAPDLAINLVPPEPFEVNFNASDDVLSLTIGRMSGTRAYDSDKKRPFFIETGSVNIHPAGSSCYSSGSIDGGELCGFVIPKRLRESLIAEFDLEATALENGSIDSLRSAVVHGLAETARRFVLSGCIGGRIVAESLAALAMT